MKANNLLAKLSVQQLQRALALKKEIAELEVELGQILGGEETAAQPAGRRKMSAAARARISAAQKARWAERRKGPRPAKAAPKQTRHLSAEGRARIVAATKARWARVNAEKKKKPVT